MKSLWMTLACVAAGLLSCSDDGGNAPVANQGLEVSDGGSGGLYASCRLPDSAALAEACAQSNCVVDFVFACETKLCASSPRAGTFCTSRCGSDPATPGEFDVTTCGAGFCREFTPGFGEYYCVPSEVLP